jgi:hypothetical protein
MMGTVVIERFRASATVGKLSLSAGRTVNRSPEPAPPDFAIGLHAVSATPRTTTRQLETRRDKRLYLSLIRAFRR